MAQKKFNQNFAANFTGIDGESTPLESDSGGVNRAVNLEQAVGNSLRGRVGCQTIGAFGQFFALFPYSYTRTQDEYALGYSTASGAHPNQVPTLTTTKTTADGATINKLIGLNAQAWVLDSMTVPIANGGASTYQWYSTVSSSNIHFIIKKDGATVVDSNLGTGLVASDKSIYGLLNDINGTGGMTITPGVRTSTPPLAIVSGNQTSAAIGTTPYGNTWRITVAAGHTFKIGDIVTFPPSATTPILGTPWPLSGGLVIAINTAGNNITYVGVQVSVTDGSVLGYLSQLAAGAYPITQAVSSVNTSPFNLTFNYWRLIPEGDGLFGLITRGPFGYWLNKTSTSFYTPPTYANAQGNLYFACSATPSSTAGGDNQLLKIDSKTVLRAGLPAPVLSISPLAGANTGAYKWKAFLRFVDAQGNITEGPTSLIQSVTLAGQAARLTVDTSLYVQATAFQTRSCYKYTAEAPAAGQYFYVDDNTAAPGKAGFIQPGDRAFLLDNVTQTAGLYIDVGLATTLGTLHKTFCTHYDGVNAPSAIRVADSSGYTIPDNSEISTGLTVVFLRTIAGGNTYYVLGEMPVTGFNFVRIYDNVTDATLASKAVYEEVTLGKEHDAPPPCALVTQHQGGLVVARGFAAPNSVSFSTADGIEYFPLASNSFDVPSSQSGAITAIASDTADRLAVFKERAYYDAQGDLDGGVISINVINEGDYGIASQASLVRVHNTLVGLSRLGYVTIQDGALNPFKFKDLNARLINQAYTFSQAVAVNDYFNRNYTCSVPTGSGYATHVIDYSRVEGKTFERSYASQLDSGGGLAPVGNSFYHLSAIAPYGVFRRLDRFNGDSPTGNNGDSFIDNTSAISYILETNPLSNDEPDVLNTPIRLRVWSLPNDYVIEGWVPFSLLVEGGSSPLVAYVGSAYPGGTGATVTFSTANDIFKDVKLVGQKTHFYIVRLTTNAIRTAPFITGFELMYAEDYKKEDFVK